MAEGGGKGLTRDLASNKDAQGDSKAEGQVDGEETTMGAPAEHNLGHRATAKHHEDEGPQALSQRLAKQPVADVEHLPAAGHQLLLSTHGGGRRRRCRAGGLAADAAAVTASAGWRPL